MSSGLTLPTVMTVVEFLAWDSPGPGRWQLVDGAPVSMLSTSRTFATLLVELGRLIGNRLARQDGSGSAIMFPGIVPRVRGGDNFRVAGLAVTCTPSETEEYDVADPVLIVEILSPSNKSETWRNVWSYTTIPSLWEILILSSTAIRAQLLRRGDDGSWPAEPAVIEDADLTLDSIGFTVPMAAIYRTTRLART